MTLSRSELEAREQQFLAPYAMKSSESQGRRYPDDEDIFRSRFQKDRDRIIHTTAFRRLAYKTQVFVYYEGDHYRTRLTHSIEVAQIGTSLARALRCNEDLTEAICLAHDLGHPPFGHTGEGALNELMAGHGGFDHQRQTMRILEKLEIAYPDFPGLNLTYEVREGLVKHDTDYDVTNAQGYEPDKAGTLECQLANLADEIAYNTSDLDDGLRSDVLRLEDVAQLTLWQDALRSLGLSEVTHLDHLLRARIIRRLVSFEINDAIQATAEKLARHNIRSVADLRDHGENVARFSVAMERKNRQLKAFLMEKFYHHYRVMRMATKAQRVLTDLFNAYVRDPRQLPPETQAKFAREPGGMERVVCDYIAGMTDRYALEEHQKLFDPTVRV